MKNEKKPTIGDLQQRVQNIAAQQIELNRQLEAAQQELKSARGVILQTVKSSLQKHRRAMASEITEALRQLGVQTKITLVLEFGDSNELRLVKLDLGDGLGILQRTEKPLDENDWKTILALPWKADQREVLTRMKGNENQPLTDKETGGCELRAAINMAFKKNALPYRIYATVRAGKRRPEQDKPKYKIFILA